MITYIVNIRVIDQTPEVFVVDPSNDTGFQDLGQAKRMYCMIHCIHA
jgi:hypothetical protein